MKGQDLVYAILGGNAEQVRALLEAGADPNEVTTSPWTRMTPLAAFAASPNAGPEILSLLLAAGMRLFRGEEESKAWAMLSPTEMVERIRLAKIEPEGIGAMSSGFLQAVVWNEVERVRRYLDLGLDPNLTDPDGDPVLQIAETPEMIRLLVEAGADIEGVNDYGRTALGHACSDANLDAIRTLIDLGANVNASYDHGYSVLMNAASGMEQDPEAIRLLLAHGADAQHVSEFGHNPLHELVSGYDSGGHEREREEIARILIEAGASLEDRTNGGYTPLHFALLDGREEDALCLLRQGADANARVLPREGNHENHSATPLMLAVGFPSVVEALLYAGADPYATDSHGRTALDHAHTELAQHSEPTAEQRALTALVENMDPNVEKSPYPKDAHDAWREVTAYDNIVRSIALLKKGVAL